MANACTEDKGWLQFKWSILCLRCGWASAVHQMWWELEPSRNQEKNSPVPNTYDEKLFSSPTVCTKRSKILSTTVQASYIQTTVWRRATIACFSSASVSLTVWRGKNWRKVSIDSTMRTYWLSLLWHHVSLSQDLHPLHDIGWRAQKTGNKGDKLRPTYLTQLAFSDVFLSNNSFPIEQVYVCMYIVCNYQNLVTRNEVTKWTLSTRTNKRIPDWASLFHSLMQQIRTSTHG